MAALVAAAAAEAAYYNVLINLAELRDPADAGVVHSLHTMARAALDETRSTSETTRKRVREQLESSL